MDVGAFSDDSFEVKDWINKTFKSAGANENEDAFMSSLVMKLQLYVQQVNSALEDTSQQVLHSLPRIMRDTELLLQETVLLKDKMQSVKQEIVKVEQDTGQSMATLEKLDRIKSELQAAKQALHEADNWTVIATDLEEVFESGDIFKIAPKLVSMQQSLNILTGAVDFEDKKLQLEGLKNRLEAMASPQLVQAFNSNSVEKSQAFFNIFSSIDRIPQLLKYYHKCHKVALIQVWRNLVESEQDEGIADWMQKFYDALLSNWHDQVKWTSQAFHSVSTIETLLELYADVLKSLDPSINECIDAALKHQSEPLIFLIDLKQVTKHFAMSIESTVQSACHGKEGTSQLIMALAQAVYFPFVPYISKYNSYEQSYLSQQLPQLNFQNDDLMDLTQALGQSVPRVVAEASEAKKRCLKFTEGCGYTNLIRVIQVYLNGYLDQFKGILHTIDKSKGEQEDWNMFQMCLTFLQTLGVVLHELQQLDKELIQDVLDIAHNMQSNEKASEVKPFGQYKLLLLNSNDQKEFTSLLNAIQEGEETTVVKPVTGVLEKLCRDAHHTTYQVIFAPISTQLEQVQSAPGWCVGNKAAMSVATDLPDFSFAPQEYITQIGQYLMTLPQHLEPFLLQDNPSLTMALKVADAEYGTLSGDGRTDGGFADVLLGIIARGTCQSYCENILGIMELSPNACKQLATDIDYLGNVLEDLGLALSEHLQQVSSLLRLSPDDYPSKSSGCSPRLVAAVRQMRNIMSSG